MCLKSCLGVAIYIISCMPCYQRFKSQYDFTHTNNLVYLGFFLSHVQTFEWIEIISISDLEILKIIGYTYCCLPMVSRELWLDMSWWSDNISFTFIHLIFCVDFIYLSILSLFLSIPLPYFVSFFFSLCFSLSFFTARSKVLSAYIINLLLNILLKTFRAWTCNHNFTIKF